MLAASVATLASNWSLTPLITSHCSLQPFVMRSSASLRTHPGNDLVWIGDVASFAVNAIGRIEFQAFARAIGVLFHLVDLGGTEILAGIPILAGAAVVASFAS